MIMRLTGIEKVPWHFPDLSLIKDQFSLTIKGKSLGTKTSKEATFTTNDFPSQTKWLAKTKIP